MMPDKSNRNGQDSRKHPSRPRESGHGRVSPRPVTRKETDDQPQASGSRTNCRPEPLLSFESSLIIEDEMYTAQRPTNDRELIQKAVVALANKIKHSLEEDSKANFRYALRMRLCNRVKRPDNKKWDEYEVQLPCGGIWWNDIDVEDVEYHILETITTNVADDEYWFKIRVLIDHFTSSEVKPLIDELSEEWEQEREHYKRARIKQLQKQQQEELAKLKLQQTQSQQPMSNGPLKKVLPPNEPQPSTSKITNPFDIPSVAFSQTEQSSPKRARLATTGKPQKNQVSSKHKKQPRAKFNDQNFKDRLKSKQNPTSKPTVINKNTLTNQQQRSNDGSDDDIQFICEVPRR